MKLSEINRILQSAQVFFAQHRFTLPLWATWAAADGKAQTRDCQEAIDCRRLPVSDYTTRG